MELQHVPRHIRLMSATIDFVAMLVLAMLLSIPYMILQMVGNSGSTSSTETSGLYTAHDLVGKYWFLGLIGYAAIFYKDGIRGRSIGKRAFNLQVITNSTGRASYSIRCVVRNIFMILWPIEAIVLLITPDRRLGDYLVGTRVTVLQDETAMGKSEWIKLGISFVAAYLVIVVGVWCLLN